MADEQRFIRINSTIKPTHDNDLYPIVEGTHVSGFDDLKKEVQNNTLKITANVTAISNVTRQGNTYVANVLDDTSPVYKSEPYGNYIVTARGMTKTLVVKTPTPVGGLSEGALFTVFNESTTVPINIVPGSSAESIKGGNLVNVPPENFISLAYSEMDRNYIEIESGYIPTARLNMIGAVKASLLSDGLLHTEDGLVHDGFLKGLRVSSGIGANDVSGANWVHFKGATVTQGKDGQAEVNITANANTIDLNDGMNDVGNIAKLHLKGIEITKRPLTSGMAYNEAELTSGIRLFSKDPSASALANEIAIQYPLEYSPNPADSSEGTLAIANGVFGTPPTPSLLAYLSETTPSLGTNQSVLGDNIAHHRGTFYFDDIVVDEGEGIDYDKSTKSYTLEALEDDEADGTKYLVAFRVDLKGVAREDGFVRIYLHNHNRDSYQPSAVLRDANGHSMMAQKYYNKGESLDVMEIIGVVKVEQDINFTCHVTDNFTVDMVNVKGKSEGTSGLMIQNLTSKSKTGDALQQFQLDTKQTINFSSYYLGNKRMDIDWLTAKDSPMVAGEAGKGMSLTNGMHFYNLNRIKVGVQGGNLTFENYDLDLCDFSFGKVFSAEETRLLRGKEVAYTAKMTNTDNAVRIALVSWTSIPDAYTDHIFSSRRNNIPTMDPHWTLVDSHYISKDSTSDHDVSGKFTVPADAINYGIIIYPEEAQTPMRLGLKEFDVNVVNPFTGYFVKSPELYGELHLDYDETFKRLIQDNQGHQTLTYDINNVPTTMPVGIPKEGSAKVSIDTSVAQIPNSTAKGGEGAIVFNNDGDATITTKVNLGAFTPVDGKVPKVSFWYSKFDDKDDAVIIPESKMTKDIGNIKNAMNFTLPTFTMKVKMGDRITLMAQAENTTSAEIQALSPTQPAIDTHIGFNEYDVVDTEDTWKELDFTQFDNTYTKQKIVTKTVQNATQVVLQIDLPPHAIMDVVAINKIRDGNNLQKVKNAFWHYITDTGVLTVGFNELVDEAQVVLAFYQ